MTCTLYRLMANAFLPVRTGKSTTFEAVAISLSTRRGPVILLAIYRPGSSSPSSTFFHELSAILEQFTMYNSQLVITGDLSLHLENPLLHETVEFTVVLDQSCCAGMALFFGFAPVYLQELCHPVSTLVERQALRSPSGGKLP